MPKAILVALCTLSLAASSPTNGPISADSRDDAVSRPDLILYHGKIFTADPAAPYAEAIAIRGDRIAGVGTDKAILASSGEATRKVDLGGRTVIPGINDAHDHLEIVPFGVKVTAGASNGDPSLPAITDAVRRASEVAPPGAWLYAIVGPSIVCNPAGVRGALDQAAGDHPALLFAWWGHGVIVNTKGLESLGIKDDAKDPPGGRYVRDGSGRLTGLLEEYAGWRALRRLHTTVPVEKTVAELRRYAESRLRYGVTSVQLMTNCLEPELVARVLQQAQLSVRVRAIKWPMPDSHGLGLGAYEAAERHPTPLSVLSGTKYVIDGTPIEQLAFQSRPYPERPGWHGRLNFPRETIRDILASMLESEDQLLLHVVGDASVDVVLTEMEHLASPTRWGLLRVRLEHADGVTGRNLERARRLGIVIAQPRHEGAPWRTWLSRGIPLAYGSDQMPNPFEVLLLATIAPNRPGEAISREEAVGLMTRGSAYAEFAERDKGMLSPGMWADLTVLSQDIFVCPNEALTGTESVLTMIGGRVAYDARVLDMKGSDPLRK
jgi:predicted amidohydrolase YtcJ